MTTGVYGRLPSPTEIAYLQALPLPENEEEREAYILKFRNALLHPENEHQNNTDETGRAPISPESIQYLTVRGHTGKQFNKSGLIKASASINAPAALPSAEREFQKNRYRGDIVGGDKSSQESKMTEATKTVEPQLKQKIKKRTKRRPKKNNSKEIPMITAEDKVEQFPKPAVKYDNALARQGTSREPDYEWIPSPNHSDYLLPPIPQNEPLNENMINPDDAPDPSNYCLPSILQNEPLNENLIDTDDELSNEELQFLFSDSL